MPAFFIGIGSFELAILIAMVLVVIGLPVAIIYVVVSLIRNRHR